jgi:hypothetical protein
MKFCLDSRAQSLQIGFILIFGILVLAMGIFQSQGVPHENAQAEYEHSQEIADDMLSLNLAIFDTTVEGSPESVELSMGASYNDRLFFIYPPDQNGVLQSTDPVTAQLENVTATDSEQAFSNYWDSTTREYTTRHVEYDIDYQQFDNAPTYSFEYGVLGANYDDASQLRLAERQQPVVDGTDITLVVYDGDFRMASTTDEGLIVERTTTTQTVTVEDDPDSGQIHLRLPTQLREDAWKRALSVDEQSTVENVSRDGGVVDIELDSTKEYSLTIHKVNVGPSTTIPDPRYLKNVSNDGEVWTFELRDKYNNLVEESTEAWVYNSSNYEDPADTVTVSDGKMTYNTSRVSDSDLCVSIKEDVQNADSFETLETVEGACP